MGNVSWNWWWLLDRVLIDRVLGTSRALAGPAFRPTLVGEPCLLDGKSLKADTVDPAGLRFALAALRRQAARESAADAVTALVERAVLESAAVYDRLGGPECERAAGSVESIAARLVPVAPIFAEVGHVIEDRLDAWRADHQAAQQDGPDWAAVLAEGHWFAQRIADVSPALDSLTFIRGADSFRDYHDDQEHIAARLAKFVASSTWRE